MGAQLLLHQRQRTRSRHTARRMRTRRHQRRARRAPGARHLLPRAAALPRHPRQPHRENQQLLQAGSRHLRLHRAELHDLPHQGEPDAPRGGRNRHLRKKIQHRPRSRLQTRAARRARHQHRRQRTRHLQRLQRRKLRRARTARPENGTAHIPRGRETQRAAPHSRCGQAPQSAPQHRHTHQALQLRLRQMGRKRRRPVEIRPQQLRTARSHRLHAAT